MTEFQHIRRVTHDINPLDMGFSASGSPEPSIIAHTLTIELNSSDVAIDCNLLAQQLALYVKQTRIE